MTKKDRDRIDYTPNKAALEALGLASAVFPNTRAQAMLGNLVMSALCDLHRKPPTRDGSRAVWRYPADIITHIGGKQWLTNY